jgi:hypothetical protein
MSVPARRFTLASSFANVEIGISRNITSRIAPLTNQRRRLCLSLLLVTSKRPCVTRVLV